MRDTGPQHASFVGFTQDHALFSRREAWGVQYFNIGLHTRGVHGVDVNGPMLAQG